MIEESAVNKVLERLPIIEAQLSEPGQAANQTQFQALVREHAALKGLSEKAEYFFGLQRRISENQALIADATIDEEIKELARAEIEETEPALPAAEKALMVALLPPDESEERNAVMEIRAGTGGDEAALFAADLFRMYSRYAEAHSWQIKLVDASHTDTGGYKEIVFTVEGNHVFRDLQYESGGHRVQRIPVTESSGRIHTSAATVAVFPEAEAQDEIAIPPDEIRIDIFRSSGPGGQSVNTTDSAVRLTHVPTGIVVQCQDEKSQHRNRERALSVLKTRILDLRRREEAARIGASRRAMIGSGDRSERIRTYNFPQNRLTDHRINVTLYSLDKIIEGDLDELVAALRDHDVELRIADELAERAGGG